MDELRERYLQGKLTEAEQRAFEETLSKEELEELALELGIREGLESGFRSELRRKVADFEKKDRAVKMIKPAYLGIAASLILAASLVFIFSGEDESLFEQYYKPYPNYEMTAIRGEEALTVRQKAYQSYDEEDYEAAIADFSRLDSLSGPDYFFRGICNVETNSDEQALADFDRVITMREDDYKEAASWYTALLYVKLKERHRAKPLLKQLGDGNSEFAADARKLLSRL